MSTPYENCHSRHQRISMAPKVIGRAGPAVSMHCKPRRRALPRPHLQHAPPSTATPCPTTLACLTPSPASHAPRVPTVPSSCAPPLSSRSSSLLPASAFFAPSPSPTPPGCCTTTSVRRPDGCTHRVRCYRVHPRAQTSLSPRGAGALPPPHPAPAPAAPSCAAPARARQGPPLPLLTPGRYPAAI